MSKPLRVDVIDSSSGVLFPFYDHDTNVVFCAGKVRKGVGMGKKPPRPRGYDTRGQLHKES